MVDILFDFFGVVAFAYAALDSVSVEFDGREIIVTDNRYHFI